MVVRRSLVLGAALSGWLLVAACGSDDDGSGTPSPGASTATATVAPTATPVSDAAAACVASGGAVSSRLCCASRPDFPNTCGLGACGCSPSASRTLPVCECGDGQCFDGSACVAR